MPELPEVENTRRYLIEAGLPGRTFTGADIGWAKTVQKPSLEDFVLGLTGGTVQEVTRRGKYLLIKLSSNRLKTGPTLIVHLGMTGGLRIQPASQPAHPMVRHTFFLDDKTQLRFQDGRKFGKLWLTNDAEDVLPALSVDPLSEEFTPKVLRTGLNGRSAPVKALLLEQSIVSGMGNLYADESLFLAGISPLRPASKLSLKEVSRLKDAIVACLTAALESYDRSRAEQWPDPPMGLSSWSIPRETNGVCPRCGGPISTIRVRARGTCFCPKCQK